MSKRFLFLFSDTGGGHRSGAQAVARALTDLYGKAVSVQLLDVFVESQKWPFYHFPGWYPAMLKVHSIPWKIGFEFTDHRLAVDTLTKLAVPYVKMPFQYLLSRYPADVIVSFHPLPNRLLALATEQWGFSAATATVVLDFLSAPAFWFAEGLDLYVVPYAEMSTRAQQLGVEAARVEALGMPVRQEVLTGRHLSHEEAKRQLGIDPGRPMVLLLGGGDGVGPLEAIATELLRTESGATIAVISGHNQHLQQRLRQLAQDYPWLRVEGFAKRMDLWLRAADILVTKAGPNTLAEAFVMGVPTVLFAAIPGQEDGNVTLVEKYQAGIWAPGPRKSTLAVQMLLADPQRRMRMGERARSLATPDAAKRIAERLWCLHGDHSPVPSERSQFHSRLA